MSFSNAEINTRTKNRKLLMGGEKSLNASFYNGNALEWYVSDGNDMCAKQWNGQLFITIC